MAVLTAAGVQSEAQLPFAGLHQLLQPLLVRIGELAVPQREALKAAFGMTDKVAPELVLIALATLELLADAAARGPLLVVADDAQWLDGRSSEVLAFVARRVSFEPMLVLIALRDGSAGVFEAAGLPERELERLTTSPPRRCWTRRAPASRPMSCGTASRRTSSRACRTRRSTTTTMPGHRCCSSPAVRTT
jgi:hypothetical protein